MSDDDKPETMTFGIREDGTVEVDGVVIESPLLDELEPAQEAPADPEKEQLKARLDELEAFEPLIRSIGRGEVNIVDAAPVSPPPPAPEDIAGYHQRLSRPGSDAILKQLNDYATVLPAEEVEKLAGDHRVFNEAFDRFAAANKPPDPVPLRTGPSPAEVGRVLTLKEVRKEAARTIGGGSVDRGGSESYGGGNQDTGRDKEIARLKMAIRRNPTDTDLAARLAKFYIGDPE